MRQVSEDMIKIIRNYWVKKISNFSNNSFMLPIYGSYNKSMGGKKDKIVFTLPEHIFNLLNSITNKNINGISVLIINCLVIVLYKISKRRDIYLGFLKENIV